SWAVNVSGAPVSLIAYPHRQTKQGVAVEVNRGKWTLLRGSFVATMDNGHTDIFKRRGPKRNPIYKLLGSHPVDALLHDGEAQGVGTAAASRSRRRSCECCRSRWASDVAFYGSLRT